MGGELIRLPQNGIPWVLTHGQLGMFFLSSFLSFFELWVPQCPFSPPFSVGTEKRVPILTSLEDAGLSRKTKPRPIHFISSRAIVLDTPTYYELDNAMLLKKSAVMFEHPPTSMNILGTSDSPAILHSSIGNSIPLVKCSKNENPTRCFLFPHGCWC